MFYENQYDEMIKNICKQIQPKVNHLDINNLKQDSFDLNKPVLQFEAFDGVLENICNVEDMQEGLNKIRQIFKDSNLEDKLYYFRIVEFDSYYWIDYGSHHTFFRVTKKG